MNKPFVLVDISLPDELQELVGTFADTQTLAAFDADAGDPKRVAGFFTYSHLEVGSEIFDRFPNLRVISNFGVGVDHIDVGAAAARGLPVGNTPRAVNAVTADFAMALLLSIARNVGVGQRFARSDAYTHYDPKLMIGTDVSGATLGVIGMGGVGRKVAQRARGFDMEVLYHNRNRDPATEEALDVRYATRAELLSRSQFVVVSVPLTPETEKLIGAAELAQMRHDAFLVNVARGPVVDTQALLEALQNGSIRGAALDVTDPEPLPRDHPLLSLDNVLITPHLGSAADRTRLRMAEMSAENLRLGLEKKPLSWAVLP